MSDGGGPGHHAGVLLWVGVLVAFSVSPPTPACCQCDVRWSAGPPVPAATLAAHRNSLGTETGVILDDSVMVGAAENREQQA